MVSSYVYPSSVLIGFETFINSYDLGCVNCLILEFAIMTSKQNVPESGSVFQYWVKWIVCQVSFGRSSFIHTNYDAKARYIRSLFR